jgi:hypothetical protein
VPVTWTRTSESPKRTLGAPSILFDTTRRSWSSVIVFLRVQAKQRPVHTGTHLLPGWAGKGSADPAANAWMANAWMANAE